MSTKNVYKLFGLQQKNLKTKKIVAVTIQKGRWGKGEENQICINLES